MTQNGILFGNLKKIFNIFDKNMKYHAIEFCEGG